MILRPGLGGGTELGSKAKNSENKFSSKDKVPRAGEWDRLKEHRGSTLLGKPAMDFYEPTGFKQEFTDEAGKFHKHYNPVDAFRHVYSAGLVYRFGGEIPVEIATFFTENEEKDGPTDKSNNRMGVSLLKEFSEKYGRKPSDDEWAVVVVDAILEGRVSFKNEGRPEWRERIREATQPTRQEMMDRLWEERRSRPGWADPLPPRELERGHRPGLGDGGRTIDA